MFSFFPHSEGPRLPYRDPDDGSTEASYGVETVRTPPGAGRRPVHLAKEGFDLAFPKPSRAATARADSAYQFTRYYYEYHRDYGSDQMDGQSVDGTEVEKLADGKRVSLTLNEFVPGYVYLLDLKGLRVQNGTPVTHPTLYYTAN